MDLTPSFISIPNLLMELPVNNQPGTRKRAGVRRMIRHHLKVDMTPMVDLGFLLITFFVITAELSEPKAMNLIVPTDGPSMPLGQSDALTVLLDKDNTVYYYNGNWEDALAQGQVTRSSYAGKDGIRNVIMEKQIALDASNRKEGREGLMLIIKATSSASYKNIVDMLDEAAICIVKKHAVVKISADELNWLRTSQ